MQKKRIKKKRKINPKKFAQASKGQKIGYRWTVRERKIDGKERLVRIRCIKGKIEMQVLDDLRYTKKKPKKKITKPKIEKEKKPRPKPPVSKEIKSERYFLFKGRIRIPVEKEINGKTYKLHIVRDSSMAWATMEASSIRKKENCYAQAIKVKGYPTVYKRKKIKGKPKPKLKPKFKIEDKDEIQKEINKVKRKIIKIRQVDPKRLIDVEYTFDDAVLYPKNTEEYNLAKKYLELRIKQSKMKIEELKPKEHQKGKDGKEIWNSDIHYKIMDEEVHIDILNDNLETLEIIEQIPIPKPEPKPEPKVEPETPLPELKRKRVKLTQDQEDILILEKSIKFKEFKDNKIDDISDNPNFEKGARVITDSYKISLLTTPQSFRKTAFYKDIKKSKIVEFDDTRFILMSGEKFAQFEKGGDLYEIDKFKQALKQFKNPVIKHTKGRPLIIEGDNLIYALAPRIYDEELDLNRVTKKEYEIYDKFTKSQLESLININELSLEHRYTSRNKNEIIEFVIQNVKKGKIEPPVEKPIPQTLKAKLKSKSKLTEKEQKLLLKNMALKFREFEFKKPDIEMENLTGIMDETRISALVTTQSLKKSVWNRFRETGKLIDKDTNYDIYLENYGNAKTIGFDKPTPKSKDEDEYEEEEEFIYYKFENVENAMKNFKNPKMYYTKETPLLVCGDVFSYALAPKFTTDYKSLKIKRKEYEKMIAKDKNELLKTLKEPLKKSATKDQIIYAILKEREGK